MLAFAGIAAYVSYHMAIVMGATPEQLVLIPCIDAGLFVVMAILAGYMEAKIDEVNLAEHNERKTEMFDRIST